MPPCPEIEEEWRRMLRDRRRRQRDKEDRERVNTYIHTRIHTQSILMKALRAKDKSDKE